MNQSHKIDLIDKINEQFEIDQSKFRQHDYDAYFKKANKKIETKSKALPFIKTIKGRNKCLEGIKALENKILTLKQQLQFNYLRGQNERDKKINNNI